MKWIIFIIIIIVVAVFFAFLKRRQDQVEASFQKRFAGKKIRYIDKFALYMARDSDGYSHFRGTGYLVLTEDELYFERRLNRKIVIIPTGSIVRAEETRRLAGQSTGKMMLKVVFETQNGEQDAIAWRVKKRNQWIKEISMATNSIEWGSAGSD